MSPRSPRAAALLSLALAAAPLAAAGDARNPDVFTQVGTAEADSLDPAWAQDTASMSVILNIYETLFQFEDSALLKIRPLLAAKIPTRENGLISADGKTYVIPIREDVVFHDGSPMTPEDVRYSLVRFLLADRAAGPSWLLLEPLLGYSSTRDARGKLLPRVWEDVNRAVATEGNNLVLRLPRPYEPLLVILASRAPVVVSKAWAVKHGGWDGTEATWRKYNDRGKQSSPFFKNEDGTGPFSLKSWDRKAKRIVLARNDRYWRAPARLETVVIKVVHEFSTRKLMLQAGDADSIDADRPQLSLVQGLPGVQVIDDLPTMAAAPVVFFTYRVNAPGNPLIGSGKLDGAGVPPDFFSDEDVRRAFAYSFDYKRFISETLGGKAVQATGCVPPLLLGHDADGRVYRLDPAKAEEHFRKALGGAAWTRGFKLAFVYDSGDVEGQDVAQILKKNIESLNPKFHLDVRGLDWPAFLDAQHAAKLPLYVTGWAGKYPDSHDFAFAFLHSKGFYPTTQKFSNPEFDRLVDAANAEADPDKRRALYASLQSLEFEEVPHLMIADKTVFRVQRDWVKGWQDDPIFPGAPAASYFYGLWKE